MQLEQSLYSYSRLAGLKSTRGDSAGAIADLERAAALGKAAKQPSEGIAWAEWQLGMPGAYDVLSALLFEQMGFKAIQGTSGGIAVALGYPDGEVMSREMFIEVSGSFAAAVTVPFNADGERGYGDEAGVGDTVRALVARGVAGMNSQIS